MHGSLLPLERFPHERVVAAVLPGVGIPAGFEVMELPAAGRGARTLVLRTAVRENLLAAGADDPARLATSPLVCGWTSGGRVSHPLIRAGGETWVLKAYRRGGLVRFFNACRYWGHARFLRELRLAALAEEAGVPTPEVLALILEGAGFGSVRAWLLSRHVSGGRPAGEYLGQRAAASMARAAGQAVRRMHEAGVDHHDLHLDNIVGAFDSRGARACIVDWDRARLRRLGWNANRNLFRLWSSLEEDGRVDRRGARRLVRAFVRAYFAGRPAALRDARRYFARRQSLARWFHRWRLSN